MTMKHKLFKMPVLLLAVLALFSCEKFTEDEAFGGKAATSVMLDSLPPKDSASGNVLHENNASTARSNTGILKRYCFIVMIAYVIVKWF